MISSALYLIGTLLIALGILALLGIFPGSFGLLLIVGAVCFLLAFFLGGRMDRNGRV